MRKFISISVVIFFILSLSNICLGQKNRKSKRVNNSTSSYKKIKPINTKYGIVQGFTEGRGVYLKWQMEIERNNLGFNVYRFDGFRKIKVNPGLIGGGLLKNGVETLYGFNYSFFDPDGKFRSTYVIETFDVEGKTLTSSYIFPRYVKDLTRIAGVSNDDLLNAKTNVNNLFEKDEPILPQQLAVEIAQNSLPPDFNKQKFIASQPGVKIGVQKEGFYRISRTELQNAGFDVNLSSDNWQLYVNGLEQRIIVGENDDYIEFYGNGVDTNETDTQIYYLINGAEEGKRIEKKIRKRLRGNVVSNSFNVANFRKDRVLYIGSIRNGEESNFFSDKVVNSTGTNVEFDVKDIDYSTENCKLTIKVQGFSLLPHNIEATLNGELLGNISGNNRVSMSLEVTLPTNLLIDGTNTLHLKEVDLSNSVSVWDSLQIEYGKLFNAQQNQLSFYTNHYKASTVTGFTSDNIRVFDVTYPNNPNVLRDVTIIEDNGDFGVHLPAHRSKRFFAVEDSSILSPASIEQNIPSTISTTTHNGEFLVISYKDWINEANDWANYRAGEGFSTKVVDVEDVFDEFNFGRVSANAIRDFLNYAKNNWQTPPNYVLLLGDTSFDPRDFENRGNVNYMPVQMIDTLYEETGSDESMADFDNDGLAEIAIGRIPARDASTVTLVLNKVMSYEQNFANSFDRGSLFVSDFPNGYDFEGLNQRLADELPSTMTKVAVNRADTDARNVLLSELDTGRFLVNYSGHGSTGLWSATAFFSIFDVPNLTNDENSLTIFSMLTCLNGYFIRTNEDSMAEYLLFAPDKGGVAVWASTGLTTPDVQEVMGKKYFQNFSDPNIERLGDSIKVSKESLIGGRDVRLSWALIGDPLLKIR